MKRRSAELEMPGVWEAVAARLDDPSDDFLIAGARHECVITIEAGNATFRLHFPHDWLPKNIAETTKSVLHAADQASRGGRMAPAEAMRCSLAYLVVASEYARLAVGPTRGQA